MLPDKKEHCIVFMKSWDVSSAFWSFSKCNITIPLLTRRPLRGSLGARRCVVRVSALTSHYKIYTCVSHWSGACNYYMMY